MTRLQNLNLPKKIHDADITGNEDDSVFENFPSVFLMVIMVIGQASTIKVIQLQQNIDTCSGMPNTERLRHIIKTIGILHK